MKYLCNTILILSLFISSVSARKLSDLEKSRVNRIISHLRATTHSVLSNKRVRISIHSINNPKYFFESNFTVGRFLFGINKYRIGVNPIVFDHNITDEALTGVLAHELVHTEDYYQGTTLRTIIPIGFKVLNSKSRRKYERQTDLKLVKKGHGLSMKSYRLWQYKLLDKEDIAVKKAEYLGPKEFDFLEEVRFLYPDLIDKWIKNPPKNFEGFKTDLNKYINS